MSKNKNRTPKEKMKIVLEALQNDSIAETCRKHGIYESQFYQWKKKLTGSADKVFRNRKKKDPEKEQLKDEVERLKQTLVEQTCELQILKKNDR
ncbi:transposase [Natronospora cellulosivora (SeqCode)]